MSSQSKAIDPAALRNAVAQAVGVAAVYVAVIGGVMYQVAVAAGYTH